MQIRLRRYVFGIKVIPIGRCECDQDYCLTCEVKFRAWGIMRKLRKV